MAVISHGPETRAAAHSEYDGLPRDGFSKMESEAKELNVSIQGAWVDAPSHVFFMVADAPDAHAVNTLMVKIRLFHWNTVVVHPITTVEEAIQLAAP